MEITIFRQSMNHLYTMGQLRINGQHQTYTVEDTQSMLPAGHYIVRIVKRSARRQTICIFSSKGDNHTPLSAITVCHSWIGCRKYRQQRNHPSLSPVSIGTPIIPGAMYKGIPVYERITDRLMKCTARKEPITLSVSERNCIQNRPISHWLTPVPH